jgi:hypothetical protein
MPGGQQRDCHTKSIKQTEEIDIKSKIFKSALFGCVHQK